MAIQIEIVLIAGVVAIGLIVLGRAIATGRAISRRSSHHLAEKPARRRCRQPLKSRPQITVRRSMPRGPRGNSGNPSSSSPVAIRMTLTALRITSAGRFLPVQTKTGA